MKEKSFEGATQAEADQLADDWVKWQTGITEKSRRAIMTRVGPGTSSVPPDERWVIVLEYDDGLN
jgi:hypothetical protein